MSPSPDPPKVRVAATGDRAERHETVRVTKPSRRTRKVVMSLGAGSDPDLSLPDLRPGDRLWIGAELEVTTDCKPGQAGNVGTPYAYAPAVEARLLLAGDANAAEEKPGRARSLAVQRLRLSHEQHHHVFVFTTQRVISRSLLPGRGRPCVNLALSATSTRAKTGNVLLVGQNDQDRRGRGIVGTDMGRICAVRLRPATQPAIATESTSVPAGQSVPILKGSRTVVCSHPLTGLRKGEQLEVRAGLETSAAHLRYPARISTRLFLAESASDEEPGRYARGVASLGGKATKFNGFNCVRQGGWIGATAKVGVLRMLRSPRKTLYLNLVAVGGDPEKRGRPGDELEVRGGSIEVVRYGPELEG